MDILGIFTYPFFYLMVMVLIILLIGIYFVLSHKPENWFFYHKLFMGLGLIIAIIGFIVLGVLSLTLINLILGVLTIILLVLSIMGGFIANKQQDNKLRSFHIWFGRAVYIIATIVLIIGIITFLLK
ncbi:MAG: hypothetical protein GF317_02690 [Candidatus Lokiarchaeota archaeon]|nr:hypothetical protein [Candidatus Lokiarchaeota archaeon]MBD3198814.1 hypothetical protein [Candidatus Lokiarchaeota archaeon]